MGCHVESRTAPGGLSDHPRSLQWRCDLRFYETYDFRKSRRVTDLIRAVRYSPRPEEALENPSPRLVTQVTRSPEYDDRAALVHDDPYGPTQVQQITGGGHLDHNCVQVVGAREGGAKPHTDTRSLCRFAAVIYLLPDAPPQCGTGFYRQRMPDGRLGGNRVDAPYDNMVDALGTRFVPAGSFVEELRLDNVLNRMLLYQANIVHSASAYCGDIPAHRRMTNVFFWQADV